MFTPREDAATGRRWRYRLPLARVALAGTLTASGLVTFSAGLALSSLAATVCGALLLVPGAFASYTYARIMLGRPVAGEAAWLEVVDVDDGAGNGA